MAPNGDAGRALERLKKKRQDMSVARTGEDAQRNAKKVKEDKEFEATQQRKFTALEAERNTQLAQQQMDAQASLIRMRADHTKERDELQQRQEREIASLINTNDTKRVDVEAKHDDLKHGLLRQAEERVESRKRADEELKSKRDKEDELLKNDILKAMDAEILEEASAKQKDITSGNKRTSSGSQSSSLPSENPFAAESVSKR
jgi:hypothetical protein